MAVPRKLVVVPNSSTNELWRIAESGEMDELAAVLPRADVNARNEHGTTALMRAASSGHVQMVRLLLENGADPNIKRNDNFTALSLAAFFGHAAIVEILMRHGANANVATRFDTSPHMWARARNFGDVAKCLEKRTVDTKKPVTPQPVSRPAPPVAVKTLKEPPEIWDLVQEAPRNFNARSAFVARMGSKKAGLVVIVAALVVMVGAVVGVVLFLNDVTPVPVAAPVSAAEVVPQPPANQSAETSENLVTETPLMVNEPVTAPVTTNVTRRSRPLATSRAISTEFIPEPEIVETADAPPVVAPPKLESGPPSAGETKKPAIPANSQVISPPKNSQPKGKVIQWP